MRRLLELLVPVFTAYCIGCGGSGAARVGLKSDFYERALALARESRDAYAMQKGRWISKLDAGDASFEDDLKSAVAVAEASLRGLQQERNKHFESSPASSDPGKPSKYPPRNVLIPAFLDQNANGKVEADELPEGVYQRADGFFDYTPAAKSELDAWQAKADKLEASITSAEDKLRHAENDRREKRPERRYLLTVADIKEILGPPSSILKNRSDRQLWSYKFDDGAVRFTVTLYPSPDARSLDDQTERAMLDPDTVETL